MHSPTRTASVWALALILSTSSFAPNAQAASNYNAGSTAPDFHQTCDDVLGLEEGIHQAGDQAWTVGQQKLSYCAAARDSQSAASKNGLLSKVWAGVAGVCTTACIGSFFTFGAANMACTVSNIGGGVTDAVVTKEFQSALTSIGTGLVARQFLSHGQQVPNTNGTEGTHAAHNVAACMSAGIAAFSSFNKNKVAGEATTAMNGNLVSAAALGPVTSVMGPTQTQLATGQNNVTTNNIVSNTRVTGGALSGDDQKKKADAACDGAASSGDTTKVTACALASDKNLPAFVGTSKFNSELQKATGKDLGGFVAFSGSPSNAIGAASGLTGEGANKFGQLLAATEKAVAGPSAGESVYAGGGGGAPSAGAAEEPAAPDFAAAMAKLMGKGGKDDEKGDPRNIKFSGKPGVPAWLRGPASEDDKNFSLFDRVTYRYYFIGRRIIFDEDATPGAKN